MRNVTIVCISLVLLALACGQSTPFANLPAPTVAPSPPPGGAVPAQLLGDWLMQATAAKAIAGGACPTPLAVSTCMFRLTFTTTTYNWTTNVGGFSGGGRDIVVNGTEMDFFNGQECGVKLPQGIGRYTWTLSGGVLQFAPMNQDTCPRAPWLANQSYTR